MRWIDAHVHLSDRRMAPRLEEELSNAAQNGIEGFLLGGVDPEDWERQEDLARRKPGVVWPVFGVHPWTVAQGAEKNSDSVRAMESRLRRELERTDRACFAIGETGLDFHPRFDPSSYAEQERSFRNHLRMAAEFRLPLVLHLVRAHGRALKILKEEFRQEEWRNALPSNGRGIVHSFSGDLAQARAYLDMGLTPSISAPVITRASGSGFEKLRRAMVTLRATEFVIETDAPDQPPAGEEGPNRLTNLRRVAEKIAELRGEKAEDLLDESARTLRRIFRLPNPTAPNLLPSENLS